MATSPSENTLELNVTHEILNDLEPLFGRVTAKSPTRVDEGDLGYDVQLSFALRTQFQYKRPQTETNRGVSFKVNGQQVSTLRMRDPTRTAFLTCPIALREDEIPGAIERTAFVDVNAVSSKTSRLYIPANQPIGQAAGAAKIKNGSYYQIPRGSIYSWDDLLQGIQNRNIGMIIRRQMNQSSNFESFMRRLWLLENLFTRSPRSDSASRYRTDGGEDNKSLNQEYMRELTSFATEQQNIIFQESDVEGVSREEDREGLEDTIASMEDTRHPSIYKISRSTEHVLENGAPGAQLPLS